MKTSHGLIMFGCGVAVCGVAVYGVGFWVYQVQVGKEASAQVAAQVPLQKPVAASQSTLPLDPGETTLPMTTTRAEGLGSSEMAAFRKLQLRLNTINATLAEEREIWAGTNPIMKRLQASLDEVKSMQEAVNQEVSAWEKKSKTFKELQGNLKARSEMIGKLAASRGDLDPGCCANIITAEKRSSCGKKLWAVTDQGAIALVQ